MKHNASIALLAAGTALLLACNTGTDGTNRAATNAPAFDLSTARNWIEKDNAKFVDELKRGDSMALAAHYTADALVLMDNSEPQKGKDIASAWGQVIRMAGVKDFKITTTDVTGNAGLLAETGTYEMYGEGNKLIDKGKYVVVWKPENGGWKIYRDIGNSSMPAEIPQEKK